MHAIHGKLFTKAEFRLEKGSLISGS